MRNVDTKTSIHFLRQIRRPIKYPAPDIFDAVKGDCVYMPTTTCKVLVSGDAQVDEIYVNKRNTATTHSQLTFNGGKAKLVFDKAITLSRGNCIGAGTDASGVRIVQPVGFGITVSKNKLTLKNETVVACNGETYYTSLATAISSYTGGVIQLLKNVSTSVTVNKNAIIDLNGYSITGRVTVSSGKTLYVMDAATNDYDIDDGNGYGKISKYSGTILPASARVNGTDDYMKITETGGISFHRVNLTLTHVTLGVNSASIRYKSEFEGDRLVAANVKQYGIAFNLLEAPKAETMEEGTFSVFTEFKAGQKQNGAASGTSVVNIMKVDQTTHINGTNANRPIYGSAYIIAKDGTYYFGESLSRSFCDVVQAVDSAWQSLNDEQKSAVLTMYKSFENNMKIWGLTNIMTAAN